jgi:Protein of unknown function (DUF3089)
MRLAAVLLVVLVLAVLAEVLPLVPVPTPRAPDYGQASSWLCRPDRPDICAKPTTATVFDADGSTHTVTYAPDPAAKIDCFYVYPTVSRALGDNAPIAATADEIGAARNQFARFASVCRTFAPLYRQVTRKGLPKVIDHTDFAVGPRIPAYADVRAAWKSYLANDNAGRGVVLIGHSQGAKMLARLIADEIDGKPVQARFVGAIIPGTQVDVPEGKLVGGSFAHVPLCARSGETGCVIAYSTYPADRPLAPDTRFGRALREGTTFACVDPAALAGVTSLQAELPLHGERRARLGTDFAELPGLISSKCTTGGPFSVLAISVKPSTQAGETAAAMIDKLAEYSPPWGLHGLDINLAEGTLVDIVRRQAAAYAEKK